MAPAGVEGRRVRVRRANSGHPLPWLSLFCVYFSWTSLLWIEWYLLSLSLSLSNTLSFNIFLPQLVKTPSGKLCALPWHSLSTAPSYIASLYSAHIFVNSPFSKHLPKYQFWGISIHFLLRLCLPDKPERWRYASLREHKRNCLPIRNENSLVEVWEATFKKLHNLHN